MTKKVIAWQYKTTVKESEVEAFENFAELAEAVFDMSHSEDGKNENLTVSLFFEIDEFFDKDIIKSELAKITNNEVEIIPVYEQDWQAESIQSFPPIEIGRFYIHSFEEQAPAGTVSLKIPAKMAFGTGEHATTKGCLCLYDELAKSHNFKNGLDMGCGSAILAMAANKADNVKFLGVDIDLLSVDIANENLVENDINSNVTIIHGDGFNDPLVTQQGKYDLIFANILKNPLLEMAPSLVEVLADDGFVILSGFKEVDQKAEIIAKYAEELGLIPVSEFNENGWSALCLKKGA